MAIRPIFRFFCISWFGTGLVHNLSGLSDFGFQFAKTFVIETRLSVLVIVIAGSLQDCLESPLFSNLEINQSGQFITSLVYFLSNWTCNAWLSHLKFRKSKLDQNYYQIATPRITNAQRHRCRESMTCHLPLMGQQREIVFCSLHPIQDKKKGS